MIREMEYRDIKAVEELGKLVNQEFQEVYDLKAMLKEDISKIYVFEEEKKIIGFLMATVLYDTADILNIAVAKEHRRKHVAQILMDYFISDLSAQVKLITLEVDTTNVPALELYEKFGFEKLHIRKKYYRDKDAYLMGRRVENNELYTSH